MAYDTLFYYYLLLHNLEKQFCILNKLPQRREMPNLAGIPKNILTCRTGRKKTLKNRKKKLLPEKMSLKLSILKIRLKLFVLCSLFLQAAGPTPQKTGIQKNAIS